jgi:hypothetical protein
MILRFGYLVVFMHLPYSICAQDTLAFPPIAEISIHSNIAFASSGLYPNSINNISNVVSSAIKDPVYEPKTEIMAMPRTTFGLSYVRLLRSGQFDIHGGLGFQYSYLRSGLSYYSASPTPALEETIIFNCPSMAMPVFLQAHARHWPFKPSIELGLGIAQNLDASFTRYNRVSGNTVYIDAGKSYRNTYVFPTAAIAASLFSKGNGQVRVQYRVENVTNNNTSSSFDITRYQRDIVTQSKYTLNQYYHSICINYLIKLN